MPRPHHYQFAHQDLPAHFFNNSAQFLTFLEQDKAVFLHYLWSKSGERCSESERLEYALILEKRHHENFNLYVITLPKAIENAEANYILLATNGLTQLYYTSELSTFGTKKNDPQKQEKAIHCEWTADGTHQNFGALKNPDLETFVSACIKHVDTK